MRSSSGNAAVIILLLIVAAFVIVAMHEQEFRSVPQVGFQKESSKEDSPGIIDSIISTFRGAPEDSDKTTMRARMKDEVIEEKPSSKKKTVSQVPYKPVQKQHDDLGRRDRAELNDLLEKVNP